MHMRLKTICEFQISHDTQKFSGISEHGKNRGPPGRPAETAVGSY